MKLFGAVTREVPVLSITMAGVHPHDIGRVRDTGGLVVRASFAFYNTPEEADALVASLQKMARMLA